MGFSEQMGTCQANFCSSCSCAQNPDTVSRQPSYPWPTAPCPAKEAPLCGVAHGKASRVIDSDGESTAASSGDASIEDLEEEEYENFASNIVNGPDHVHDLVRNLLRGGQLQRIGISGTRETEYSAKMNRKLTQLALWPRYPNLSESSYALKFIHVAGIAYGVDAPGAPPFAELDELCVTVCMEYPEPNHTFRFASLDARDAFVLCMGILVHRQVAKQRGSQVASHVQQRLPGVHVV